MSNTMKVISKQGEIYIGQQEHKRYKNLELFGYGYIDWGRVINQSLVTLYDLIDSIQDGGAADNKIRIFNEYSTNLEFLITALVLNDSEIIAI